MVSAAPDRSADLAQLARWRTGSAEAWAEVFEAYRLLVFHTAYRILRNSQDAEEIVTDTFLSAHRHLASFRGDCTLATWLRAIAHRRALNRYHYWRRRHRADSLHLDAPVFDGGPTLGEALPDAAPGLIDQVLLGEQERGISGALEQLSPADRQIIHERARGASYKELADTLRLPLGTVKSRMARAREKLQIQLAAA